MDELLEELLRLGSCLYGGVVTADAMKGIPLYEKVIQGSDVQIRPGGLR